MFLLVALLVASPVAVKAARLFDATAGRIVQPGLVVVDAGFTTVRDLGAWEFLDLGLRNAIQGGAVPGPRMIIALNAIGSRGGHADLDPFPPHRVPPLGIERGICNGPEECRAAVRWQI